MNITGLNQFEPQYNQLMFEITQIDFNEDNIELIGNKKEIFAYNKDGFWFLNKSFNNFSIINETLNKNANNQKTGMELKETIEPLIISQIQKAINHFIKVYNENEELILYKNVQWFNEYNCGNFLEAVVRVINENYISFTKNFERPVNFLDVKYNQLVKLDTSEKKEEELIKDII